MNKCKTWLVERFLPAWAKHSVLEENARLKAEVERLTAELDAQGAYIDGLEAGIRAQRRIVINTGREVVK